MSPSVHHRDDARSLHVGTPGVVMIAEARRYGRVRPCHDRRLAA